MSRQKNISNEKSNDINISFFLWIKVGLNFKHSFNPKQIYPDQGFIVDAIK